MSGMSGDGALISVIVPSVRHATVGATVAAIQAQTDANWELIVSDQSGSPDGDALDALLTRTGDPRIRRIRCPGRGAALARNVGILHARGDLLAFTDDDCRPTPDWLATIRTLFQGDPDLWMATGSIVPPPGLPRRGAYVCPGYVPEERRARPSEGGPRIHSVTANAAYRRAAFLLAGPFDVCLSPGTEFCGGEEDDHGQRMELFDPVLLATPRLVVEHTYGVRRGARAAWGIKRNYAVSVGGVAGKRTLLRETSGRAALMTEFRAALSTLLRRPPAAIRSLPRAYYIWSGYRRLLAGYTVDPEKRLLIPRGAALDTLYAPIQPLLDYHLPAGAA